MIFILYLSLDHILHVQFIVIRETQMNQAEKGCSGYFCLHLSEIK